MKILYLRLPRCRMTKDPFFYDELRKIADFDEISIPNDVSEEFLVSTIQKYDILLTMWDNVPIPPRLAKEPGNLKYICNITGTLCEWIPKEIIDSDIIVTNWGNAMANNVAEGAFALLMATLKLIPGYVLTAREGGWKHPQYEKVGSLENLRVGIYGYGVIGQRFVEMLQPFNSQITIYDPFVDTIPDFCKRANSLEELFETSQALVVHAGLCPGTHKSITAELLAKLPDDAIIVNTARGGIFEEQALFKELLSGRLRAGLDVLDEVESGDTLPPDHPLRQCENVIFTFHSVSGDHWGNAYQSHVKMYYICLDNIKRFMRGETPKFIMDMDRYLKST